MSNTWPRMFGEWVPSGLVASLSDLIESPITVVFIHRWLAFAVLALAVALVAVVDRRRADPTIRRGLGVLIAVVVAQILLGIATVLTSVEVGVALAHQGGATALFGICTVLLHRLRSADASRSREPTDPAGLVNEPRLSRGGPEIATTPRCEPSPRPSRSLDSTREPRGPWCWRPVGSWPASP